MKSLLPGLTLLIGGSALLVTPQSWTYFEVALALAILAAAFLQIAACLIDSVRGWGRGFTLWYLPRIAWHFLMCLAAAHVLFVFTLFCTRASGHAA